MSVNNMLTALGYTTSPSGVASFQRDYNKIGTRRLLVTGELDEDTAKAIRFAHGAASVFTEIREARSDGDA